VFIRVLARRSRVLRKVLATNAGGTLNCGRLQLVSTWPIQLSTENENFGKPCGHIPNLPGWHTTERKEIYNFFHFISCMHAMCSNLC
jgi:hypothetical protein